MDEKIISQDSNSSNPTNPSLAITEVSATDSNGRPSLLWTLGSQILVLVWLALIIALLTSNFEKYIAGANVGCDVVHGDRIGAQTLVTPYVSGDYDADQLLDEGYRRREQRAHSPGRPPCHCLVVRFRVSHVEVGRRDRGHGGCDCADKDGGGKLGAYGASGAAWICDDGIGPEAAGRV
jgi:hypothetical protein